MMCALLNPVVPLELPHVDADAYGRIFFVLNVPMHRGLRKVRQEPRLFAWSGYPRAKGMPVICRRLPSHVQRILTLTFLP